MSALVSISDDRVKPKAINSHLKLPPPPANDDVLWGKSTYWLTKNQDNVSSVGIYLPEVCCFIAQTLFSQSGPISLVYYIA